MLNYYMQKKCKICIKNHEIPVDLKNTVNYPITDEDIVIKLSQYKINHYFFTKIKIFLNPNFLIF